jgi:hypothetical protein
VASPLTIEQARGDVEVISRARLGLDDYYFLEIDESLRRAVPMCVALVDLATRARRTLIAMKGYVAH